MKDQERMETFGAPRFIRCNPFVAEEFLQPFDIIGRAVTREDQVGYLESCLEEDGGWVAFACGHPEQIRLFGYSLMHHYSSTSKDLEWVHVTGSQFNKFTDTKLDLPSRDMLVLDGLLTHPPMHPEGNRGYDPKRIGKLYDIVAKYRGRTSIVILCPGIDPATAYQTSMIQPDMMFHLKYRAKIMEL